MFYDIKHNTLINTLELGIPIEYKLKCIEELYKLCNENEFNTNINALRTKGYKIWEYSNIFNNLLDNIFITFKNYLKTIETNPSVLKNLQLRNAWGAIYKDNDYTEKHNHTPFFYSFVYYLKVENGNSPVIFESDVNIPVKEDMLILFPSYLNHEVPKNQNTRIIISGNIL